MPYKKHQAIRSNKKDVIYDLMTDLGLSTPMTYKYMGVAPSLRKAFEHPPNHCTGKYNKILQHRRK